VLLLLPELVSTGQRTAVIRAPQGPPRPRARERRPWPAYRRRGGGARGPVLARAGGCSLEKTADKDARAERGFGARARAVRNKGHYVCLKGGEALVNAGRSFRVPRSGRVGRELARTRAR
jgi:hypothetical protein